MKNLFLSLLFIIACLFCACDKQSAVVEETPKEEDPDITKEVFSGFVQKGPYINGSSVLITMLDEQFNQTGSVYTTQIIDNSGNFEQKNMKLTSNFVELKADGYYFNEVKGENSNGSLSLYALADIKDINSVNINILTHLERQRILYLIQNNKMSFAEAKKQAKTEVLNIFKLTLPNNISSESLNITKDVLLLAISLIVQGQLSTGDMSELLANISADVRTDGKLDNPQLGKQLMNNVAFIDFEKVKSNIEKKYNELGIETNVKSDELKSLIEHFKKNSGFEQSLSIVYPETGKYGANILADNFVEGKRYENGMFKTYSLRAELPAGNSSLKIIIKSKQTDSLYYWGANLYGTDNNWIISNFDFTIKGNIFTVYDNEKVADVPVMIESDFIIEYYENGATTPTKVKTVKVDKGDTAADDEHDRTMLVAFYNSTNGDKWIKKDNWCSDKPLSQWFGIETWYHHKSGKSRVKSIKLPNNNLTGSANLTDFKSIWEFNILNGNKIESLTIENCGNDFPDGSNYGEFNNAFYHSTVYDACNLKSLKISKSDGCVYISGNFSAETVTITDCNLASPEYMQFTLPSIKIGTITVSNCTMGHFYTDGGEIGNILIENCTFLWNSKLDNSYIRVGNKTHVNKCKDVQHIYSKLCSDLTVTDTECNDIRCGN